MTRCGPLSTHARAALSVLAWVLAVAWAGAPGGAGVLGAQEITVPGVEASHRAGLFARVEGEVQAALLTDSDDVRRRHLAAAEQLARYLTDSDSTDADAFYWLAVAQGIRTEHSGPFQKLTSGKEVFFTTAHILELDSLHAGGHEMMGRLHAAVMRLPWLVRGLALRMGMGEVLGDASWERAEWHYARAVELDPAAVAPRLELAKLYVERERAAEAVPVLQALAGMAPEDRLDEGMLQEARRLLGGIEERGRGGGAAQAVGGQWSL